jgi:hypothetical protein
MVLSLHTDLPADLLASQWNLAFLPTVCVCVHSVCDWLGLPSGSALNLSILKGTGPLLNAKQGLRRSQRAASEVTYLHASWYSMAPKDFLEVDGDVKPT